MLEQTSIYGSQPFQMDHPPQFWEGGNSWGKNKSIMQHKSTAVRDYTTQSTGVRDYATQPAGGRVSSSQPTGVRSYTTQSTGVRDYTIQPTGVRGYTTQQTGGRPPNRGYTATHSSDIRDRAHSVFYSVPSNSAPLAGHTRPRRGILPMAETIFLSSQTFAGRISLFSMN